MFNKKNKPSLSTRSATPATCVAQVITVVENKFAKGEADANIAVTRFLFHSKINDELVSNWTPWLKVMPTDCCTNEKSNWMKLFDKKKEVVEMACDPQAMFSNKFSIQGTEGKNGYINIGMIYDDGPMKDGDVASHYDLDGYPPFNTVKYYGKPYPVSAMYVRLEDGTAHEVTADEFKAWLDQPPTDND